ncbi:Reverse transcriptase domain [Trinorchestia longiramus]|nr:Reverse transcriptase domain [Trinorchestia longiramus]
MKNYRPISLLDTHAKFLDKILTYRFTDHLTKYNIYHSRQHRFRYGRGSHTALATLHDTLHIQLTQQSKIDIITNMEWHDFNTSVQLHRLTKLPPPHQHPPTRIC